MTGDLTLAMLETCDRRFLLYDLHEMDEDEEESESKASDMDESEVGEASSDEQPDKLKCCCVELGCVLIRRMSDDVDEVVDEGLAISTCCLGGGREVGGAGAA